MPRSPTSGWYAAPSLQRALGLALPSLSFFSPLFQTGELSLRKKANHRKEPLREEFPSEDAYMDAWQRWRDIRNNNNESVKKSRENSRAKKMEHDRLCRDREAENARLTREVARLREDVAFLTRVRGG